MPRNFRTASRRKPTTGRRWAIAARVTFEVRQKLEEAARASGRPMVGEVEHRLQASFAEEDMLDRVFGPVATRRVLQQVVLAFIHRGQMRAMLSGSTDWLRDEAIYVDAMTAATTVLMLAAPNVDQGRISLWGEAIKSAALTALANQ